ncbi:MAG: TonB-dependent receptor [Campylobacterota bacterium]|nr:TonB-dependent receptor [Campylobacterota bacterium]
MNKKHIHTSIAAAFLIAATTLQANEIDLGQIEVYSATQSTQAIQDVTSNINVITALEIQERNYTTITQALNSIAGVSFTQSGAIGQTTSVRVRGFDSNRVLVLIDGIRVNDVTGASGAPFADLMINDIAQIEVIKGAQSGIWGADATAGVINIITKMPKEGLSGDITAQYGSFSTKKYGLNIGYKTSKYYIKVGGQKIDTKGFSAFVPAGKDMDNYENDGYANTTTNIKLGYGFNDTNKIDLKHTRIHAYNEYDDSLAATDELNANSVAKYSTTKDSFSCVNFNHIDSFNEIDIHAKKSTFDRDYSSGTQFDGTIKDYGIKSKIPYLNNDSFVVVGMDYKTFEHKNDLNKKYNNKAFFITNSNTFDDKTVVTQSLRYDKYDAFNNKATGKIGIKHNFNQDVFVSANYGKGYNVPTVYQLYAPLCCGFFPVGNDALKPESTTSLDLTLGYKNFSITYFDNQIKDMIDYDFAVGFVNLDSESKIKGFELEYQEEIASNVLLSLNYTHLDAKDKNGYDLERRAKKMLKFGLDYYGFNKLHLGLNGEYIGNRKQYVWNTYTVEAQTGNYAVAHFVANYDLTNDIKIYGKIDNITNKYYQTVDGFTTSPRAFYTGIKVEF